MAISIDPLSFVITVPISDLTLVSGNLYTHDTEEFRLQLKAWEADPISGMSFPKTHLHNTTVTIVGITYVRAIQILPPYSVTYENGDYTVRLEGSNNNIFDVQNGILNKNNVQVIPSNSAGYIVIPVGSGLSQEEHDAVINQPERVWSYERP